MKPTGLGVGGVIRDSIFEPLEVSLVDSPVNPHCYLSRPGRLVRWFRRHDWVVRVANVLTLVGLPLWCCLWYLVVTSKIVVVVLGITTWVILVVAWLLLLKEIDEGG